MKAAAEKQAPEQGADQAPRSIEQEPIRLRISIGKLTAVFALRMISVAEERKLRQRYNDIKETDPELRSKTENEINRDALQAFAIEPMQLSLDGEELASYEQRDLLAAGDARIERIMEYGTRAFLSQLTPDVDFL